MDRNRYQIDNADDLYSAIANVPARGTRYETCDGRSLTRRQVSRRAMRLADEIEAGTTVLTLVTKWDLSV